MKKFDILEYTKQGSLVLTKDILVNKFEMTKGGAALLLKRLIDENDILRVGVDKYIALANINNIDFFQLSSFIDSSCYISLYSVLDQNIIKQAYKDIFCITSKGNHGYEVDIAGTKMKYFYSKIPQTFGISIDRNNVRIADNERALLDLIYIHSTSHLPIWSELYLKGHIDKNKIETYLAHYPKFVKEFYNNKLSTYEKQ